VDSEIHFNLYSEHLPIGEATFTGSLAVESTARSEASSRSKQIILEIRLQLTGRIQILPRRTPLAALSFLTGKISTVALFIPYVLCYAKLFADHVPGKLMSEDRRTQFAGAAQAVWIYDPVNFMRASSKCLGVALSLVRRCPM